MSNPYFRFKQFTIFQERCGMKVGTDGVLLGAWTDITGAQHILDIGTGTGLIALMLAQRITPHPATLPHVQIDAVEIDEDACIQARENVERASCGGASLTLWSNRIQVYHCSVQDFAKTCPKRYDLLVSNPPFFENAYKASKKARNVARHSDFLQQIDILQVAEQLLREDGRLAVIYPTEEAKIFQEKAEAFGFFCNRKLYVKPTLESKIKRILMELGKSQLPYRESAIAIESSRHIYTADFIALIKDFYLKY